MTRVRGQVPVSGPWSVVRGQWTGFLRLVAVALAVFAGGCGRGKDTGPATATAPVTQRALVVVVPAAKPTRPLPEKAECVTAECHATYKTAAHIHGPVAAASCQSCHMADQGGHKYPLMRTGNALCTFCHAVAGTKAHQHKALEPTAVAPATKAATAAPAGGSAGGDLAGAATAGVTTSRDESDANAFIKTTANSTSAAGSAVADAATAQVSTTGGCLACHDPHTSKSKFLLVTDTVEALCAKCHDVPLKKYAHQPFAAGQCTLCHQPHQSDYANLLRNGEGPQHCFSCHAEKRNTMAQSLDVHKAAAQSCTTCHGPHATDNPKQLKLPVNATCLNCHPKVKDQIASAKHVHGALTAGNCASCHDAHASNQPDQLKARTDKVCLTCHEKAIQTVDGRTIAAMGPVLASKNLHGPVKSGSCSECHLPHAADQPNLLKQYFPDTFYAKFDVNDYALCFSCHNPQMVLQSRTANLTKFRDGDKNLHFVHVNRDDKGRTCITCHEVHGSNLPNHMAASVPFEGSNWPMPINYEQTASGGGCTPGCHDKRTYDRSKPVTTAPAAVPATNGGPG